MMRPVQFVCNVVVPTMVAFTSMPTIADEIIAYSSGQVEPWEVDVVTHLAWPQSYRGVIGRFGYPAFRSSTADYYVLGQQRIRIDYDQNNIATGYGLEGK